MPIKEISSGIRKSMHIELEWFIRNYEVHQTYKTNFENGADSIKVIMEPKFSKGELIASNPSIMIESLRGSSKPKEILYTVVCKGPKRFLVSTEIFKRLRFNERITTDTYLLHAESVSRALYYKDLCLSFSILILDCAYEQATDFNFTQYESDFKNLFESKTFSDCEIFVDGVIIPAHKFILSARSPVLRKSLQGEIDKIIIDSQSIENVNEFIKFLYCGKFQFKDNDMLMDMLNLAAMYQVEDLTMYCEKFMFNCLTSSNANLIFQNVHKYNLSKELKNKSFRMIQAKFERINQKLGDEMINDPAYVDKVLKLATDLIKGLKNKDSLVPDKTKPVECTNCKSLQNQNISSNICKNEENNQQIDESEAAGGSLEKVISVSSNIGEYCYVNEDEQVIKFEKDDIDGYSSETEHDIACSTTYFNSSITREICSEHSIEDIVEPVPFYTLEDIEEENEKVGLEFEAVELNDYKDIPYLGDNKLNLEMIHDLKNPLVVTVDQVTEIIEE